MGSGSSSRSSSVDLTTSQKTTVTIRNSWVVGRAVSRWPHSGQNLGWSTRPLPQFGQVVMRVSIWTNRHRNRPVGDSSSKRLDHQEFGYSNGRPLARLWVGRPRARSGAVAPERKRRARDYEQTLKRQELAAGRALVQALPAEGPPGARELAAAKRVLTQALFELRRLGRDLDEQIEGLRSRKPGPARPGRPGPPGPVPWRRPGRAGPVRGGAQRRRGGRRTLGGPPRPARRRTGPPPARPPAGWAVARDPGRQGAAGPGRGQEPTGRCSRSARTTSIPPVTSFTRLNSRVRSTVTMLHTTTPSSPMNAYQRNTVPAGKPTSMLKLSANSVTDWNTPMLTSTNQMTANTSRLISIRQK